MAGLVDCAGKTAVVTGASSGIGAEFGRQLARRGARVALVARRRDRLEQLAEEIAAAGGAASVHVCDVSQRAAVEATCREVVQQWGGVDLLINNAGYGRHILVKDQDVDDIEHLMQTNYFGAVYWMKSVLPVMHARGQGWMINISSLAGAMPQPDEAAYSATKFALSALSEALAYELAPLGIHVMVVHPALVRTEMLTPEVMARLPRAAANNVIEPDAFVTATLRALGRGELSITIPRRFRAVTLLRALSPRIVGGALARIKLRAVPDRTR
jgi:short-subunit dehydrogenase